MDTIAKSWGKAEDHNFGSPAGSGGGITKSNSAKTKPLRKSNTASHSSLLITYKDRAVLEAVWLVQLNQLLS